MSNLQTVQRSIDNFPHLLGTQHLMTGQSVGILSKSINQTDETFLFIILFTVTSISSIHQLKHLEDGDTKIWKRDTNSCIIQNYLNQFHFVIARERIYSSDEPYSELMGLVGRSFPLLCQNSHNITISKHTLRCRDCFQQSILDYWCPDLSSIYKTVL